MRSLLFLSGFIVGCPSAPKIMIEGGLEEAFVEDDAATTGGGEDSVEDTGIVDGSEEDGGGDEGGGSGDDGGGSGDDGGGSGDDGGGSGDDGGGSGDGDSGSGDGDGDTSGGGDSEDGDATDGGDDGGDDSFVGAYEGIIGREIATTDSECTQSATLFVDEDNTFFVDGICSTSWGDRDLRFEGSFSDDGVATGRFVGDIFSGESEYEGEIEGYIDGDTIFLEADVPTTIFSSVKAFFYTE